MPEQEPNFEEQLEALKLSIQNVETDPEPLSYLDLARDLISAIPGRPTHLLKDLIAQRQELNKLWQDAETEEARTKLRSRIKQGLENIFKVLEKSAKS